MNRVTNITWRTASGSRLGGFAYRYDALGRIVSRSHDLGGVTFDRDYAYDGMDRLASDGDTAYAYDAAGNRTSRTEDGETVAYTLGDGDRLASWTGGSYQYDAAGCVTRITRGADTWDLAWNGQYHLVEVSTNGAFAESYSYDALGRRVTTRNAEGAERHVYDDSWQVVADLDEDGNVLRSYVWGEGIDRLLVVKIGGRTYTALTDVQGTVWGYTDEGGNVVAKWTYDAWGNVLSEEVDDSAAELRAVRYRVQGRERSAATGLTNFRMRWYDAVTGRWLSKDPIGLSGGLNLYAFCGGNPVNQADRIGLCSDENWYDWSWWKEPKNVFSYFVDLAASFLPGSHVKTLGDGLHGLSKTALELLEKELQKQVNKYLETIISTGGFESEAQRKDRENLVRTIDKIHRALN